MKYLLLILLPIYLFANEDISFEQNIKTYRANLVSRVNLKENYKELNVYWRSLVDDTPEVISKVEIFGALKSSSIIIDQNINTHFERLLITGNLRRRYLADYQIKDNLFNLEKLNKNFVLDLKREFQLIPMRLFAEFLLKIKYVKENLGNGVVGFKIIFFDLVGLLVLLFIPFIILFSLKKLRVKLKLKLMDLNRNRFKSSTNYKKYKAFKTATAYGPDILMYLLLRYLRNSNNALSFLFAIAEIYFLYKLVITLCYYTLSFVFDRSINKKETADYEVKKKVSSKRIGHFFFAYSILFHLIQYVVGGGITSLLLLILIKINIIALIFFISSRWSSEISQSLKSRTNDKVAQKLISGLEGQKRWFLSLFAFIYLIYVRLSNFLLKSLERFDIVKQISAKFFKRKLISTESFVEADVINIPLDYKNLFDCEANSENYVEPHSSLKPKVIDNIDSWIDNPNEENSIAVCGHKGSGKSSLIDQIKKNYQEKLNFVEIEIDKRISSEDELLTKIYESLGLEKSDSLMGLIKADKELGKKIIFIDKSHNLFTSTLGGFGAYKKLTEILNARFENIFWIASFNENSWDFLSAVYSKNESFRFIYKLRGWSDTDIQKMIMKRHDLSDYRLSFDKILKAIGNYDSESLEEAQEQFFRVLWEQSQGNPSIASYLWLSSLTFVGNKRIYIGLPQNDGLKELSSFSDNTLFVLAAIVKHENLSVSQAMKVTNLDEGIVRYAMKLGLENDILLRDKRGQYSLFVRYNFRIINYLKKKNLIIGN